MEAAAVPGSVGRGAAPATAPALPIAVAESAAAAAAATPQPDLIARQNLPDPRHMAIRQRRTAQCAVTRIAVQHSMYQASRMISCPLPVQIIPCLCNCVPLLCLYLSAADGWAAASRGHVDAQGRTAAGGLPLAHPRGRPHDHARWGQCGAGTWRLSCAETAPLSTAMSISHTMPANLHMRGV